MQPTRSFPALAALAIAAAGCGSLTLPTPPSCDVTAQTGCAAGLACETVATGGTVCAVPVEVRGRVLALTQIPSSPLAGARVVALDPNRAPISSVAISGADGSFSLRVHVPRDSRGAPLLRDVLLRADARGFWTFPSGVRQPFPVSIASGVTSGGVIVVSGTPTELELEPLEDVGGAGSIHGLAAVPPGAPGVLVVADRFDPLTAATVGASALADRDGDYAIYNLPAGEYTVRAFARGSVHAPRALTLAEGQDARIDLPFSGPATATVSGSVQLVNPGRGTGTSIILVVESTFDETVLRGESPPGLRAPGGLVPDVKGDYAIAGVPPGRYVALAAFENDFLVRDPDLCIGGTQLVRFGVPETLTLPGFKITGALDVISPGALGPEVVSGTPVFRWKDDSSEDGYDLTVIDRRGVEVWTTHLAGVSGADPSVTYAGPALPPGYYQFKVRSSRGTCETGDTTAPKYLSQTEDLKGAFILR